MAVSYPMLENPAKWSTQTEIITKVEDSDNYWTITAAWTYGLKKSHGVEPKVGDEIIFYTRNLSSVEGVAINGKMVFYNSERQSYRDRQKWLADYHSRNIVRFLENADEWFDKVDNYKNKELSDRIHRFEDEDEEETFWTESAAYEMMAVDSADYLIELAKERNAEDPIGWLDWWWDLNTSENGYDYKRQHEEAPGFGKGHSGNTAGAAYGLARRVLNGDSV